MLNYQTTSFHDALYVREVLGLRMAPEFEAWLVRAGIFEGAGSTPSARAAAAGVPPGAGPHCLKGRTQA